MSRIHRLDPIVANQIAAGEVVERPASVVKELIENALDADARTLEVRLWDGGTSGIDVIDDGLGMAPDDLVLAVERHTTSKLSTLDDLAHSHWLGFRGEALAAISSVSELLVKSRPASQPMGYQLSVQFGDTQPLTPVAMPSGTQVQVRRLFGRLPARSKALKTPGAELSQCQRVVEALALSRPEVSFTLYHQDRRLFTTAGRGNALDAIGVLFGRELAAATIAVEQQWASGIALRAVLAPAHFHRANRGGQAMYINGRWVQNWPLRAAVEEAFRPNIPDRRYPLFWLWITLDPSRVDPNAHPTKAEVRLVDERRLAAILYRAVHDALAGLSAVPAFSVPAPFASAPGDDASPQSSVYRPQIPTQGPHHARELKASAPAAVNQLHLLTDATDLTARHPELASLTPLAQWASKYILAQGPQGLYIIDQHAAHERIYFERFRRLGTEVQTSQLLIDAVSETLNPQEWIAFQNHRDDLTRWGFDITELGGTTVAVRAVPRAFRDLTGPWALVHTVLEVLDDPQASWNRTLHPVSWADEPHFAMAACKAAIKANRALSMLEMQSLLETLATVDDPRGCPHGRPTLIQLSLEEVDRRFGRRG